MTAARADEAKPTATAAPAARTFDFTYAAVVKDVPAGAKRLDLWLPLPQSDDHQTISDLKVDSPWPTETVTESEYGNKVLHVTVKPPAAGEVTVRFRCTRREHAALPAADGGEAPAAEPGDRPKPRFLKPDRLGVVDERVKKLADEAAGGRETPMAQARAFYDFVLDHMAYDKSGTGWGKGDTNHACDVGRGNCSDFHALFISLSRARRIPARFDLGFPLPADKAGGEVAGYHCWALFWTDGAGWVPVDASEADKNPDKAEYFFGTLDAHRVRFTTGRDLKIPGVKAKEPLNFLIYPYAELDGRPFEAGRKFAFKDVKPAH